VSIFAAACRARADEKYEKLEDAGGSYGQFDRYPGAADDEIAE
jgi:hypothetical protein